MCTIPGKKINEWKLEIVFNSVNLQLLRSNIHVVTGHVTEICVGLLLNETSQQITGQNEQKCGQRSNGYSRQSSGHHHPFISCWRITEQLHEGHVPQSSRYRLFWCSFCFRWMASNRLRFRFKRIIVISSGTHIAICFHHATRTWCWDKMSGQTD